MATKRDIHRLIKQGLSGFEVGRLVVEHNYLKDHGGEGFLTQAEMTLLLGSLRTRKDRAIFDSLLQTYRVVYFSTQKAHILTLKILFEITTLNHFLNMYLVNWRAKQINRMIPTIMTEKQFQDLLDLQKQRLLKRLHCLHEVIGCRAHRIASEEKFDESLSEEEREDFFWPELMEVYYPEYYERGKQQIVELMESGKLLSIQLKYKVSDDRAKAPEGYEIKRWSLDYGRWSLGDGRIETPIKYTKEEEEKRLSICFSGEALYEAGLPEWMEWIDTYHPELFEGEPYRVAIIQDPDWGDLDERGYYKYKDDVPKLLDDLSGIERIENSWTEMGANLKDRFQNMALAIRLKIKDFLAFHVVLKAVSDFIGVNLVANLDDWYHDIEVEVLDYNRAIEPFKLKYEADGENYTFEENKLPDDIKLSAIHIKKLKPDVEFVQGLRDLIDPYLGAWDWWHDHQQEQEEANG